MPPRADRKERKSKKSRRRPHNGDNIESEQALNQPRTGPTPPRDPGSAFRRQLQHPCPATIGTSHYSGAHDFSIETQNITTNNFSLSKTLFEHLNPHVSHGAAHNSNDRRDAPACHRETRVAIREDIVGWIKHNEREDETKNLMWLSGPAGSGKSAIAGSVAETCEEEGILAATFFFSSFSPSRDRRSSRGLIATLVHHMSQIEALDGFGTELLRALKRRPDIFHKTLKEQAQHLILAPFRQMHGQMHGQTDKTGWPKAVVIDGVDEVAAPQSPEASTQEVQRTSEDDQVEVLDVLHILSQSPYFPFRIFIASRPEQNIADFFAESDVQSSTIALFLDAKYDPDTDIGRFLESKFAQIRRRSCISDPSWPGQSAVDRIIEMSSGQFIVPTTVIRWVESGMPQEQLDVVLRLHHDYDMSGNPFACLDALYHHILTRARNPRSDSCLTVKWILSVFSDIDGLPFGIRTRDRPGARIGSQRQEHPSVFWRDLFEDVDGELNYRMAPISSLIFTPHPNDPSSHIEIYHKSLIDYLSSKTRCGELYVNQGEVRAFISGRIAVFLKNKGPRGPVSSTGSERDRFLAALLRLNLQEGPLLHNEIGNDVVAFLSNLSPDGLGVLASCDVEWWIRLSLRPGVLDDGPLLFLRGMYCRIHSMVDSYKPLSPAALQQVHHKHKPNCHAACSLWRTGILAEAKRLGWCVHELEAVPLEDLAGVNIFGEGDYFFRSPYWGPCHFCLRTRCP